MKRLALVSALALAWPAHAAADELSDLKTQLDAAKQMIQQLEKRVQQLEAAPKPAPAPGTAPQAAAATGAAAVTTPAGGPVVAPNQVPEKGVADTGARLEIYGFAQADFIQDFNRVDPKWNATLRPSKIPVNCPGDPGCGKDGETIFSVRQSRLGFQGYLPTQMGEAHAKFEFDMFGVGGDAGQTTIRLRHAYGELGPFLAGQTNSLFMDGDVFPNTIDYWGPGGMIFFRNVQARWTPINANGTKVAVALEGPGVGLDESMGAATAHTKLPDLTAQFRSERDWGHFQVAGIVRQLGWENASLTGNTSGTTTGYGINLSGSYKLGAKDKLMGQFATGKGIAFYFNDCCVDVAANGSRSDGEAAQAIGWLVYLDHYWNEKFSSSIGWSQQIQNNTGGQGLTAFHRGDYGSANLLYYPVKNVMTGVELLYGKRENNDGRSGDDTRVQFSAKYSF
jgi:hypothetical protein